jgi:hypothetical protein
MAEVPRVLARVILATLPIAACGIEEDATLGSDHGRVDGGAQGNSGAASTGGATGGAGGGLGSGQGGTSGTLNLGGMGAGSAGSNDAAGDCTAITYGLEFPLQALYLLLARPPDENTWQSTAAGVQAFVSAEHPQDTGFGIQDFGAAPGSCDPAAYATPALPITDLLGAGAAVSSSLAAFALRSIGPTGPALEGALQYTGSWAERDAERRTAVVLLTDSYPTECNPQSMTDIAALATAARRSGGTVLTYVIGIGSLGDYDVVAQAGGSGKAILLSESSPTLEQDVTAALLEIASDNFSCAFRMPEVPGFTLDPSLINIERRPDDNPATWHYLPLVSSPSDCEKVSEGWYLDDSAGYIEGVICPATCAGFHGGSLTAVYGCRVITGP